MTTGRRDGSLVEIALCPPWQVSVSEIYALDYSDEDNCLMWSDTIFHAWRPIDDESRLVIDVSNRDGRGFGAVLAVVRSGEYLPCDGRAFSSIDELVFFVEDLGLKWVSEVPPSSEGRHPVGLGRREDVP